MDFDVGKRHDIGVYRNSNIRGDILEYLHLIGYRQVSSTLPRDEKKKKKLVEILFEKLLEMLFVKIKDLSFETFVLYFIVFVATKKGMDLLFL